MVLFSPYEANQLFPRFRTSEGVRLHVFAPQNNQAVPSLEDLDFLTLPFTASAFSLPRPLALQLNLFVGSLYLQDYKTYRDVCSVLRLYFGPLPPYLAKPGIINVSGFVHDLNARKELGMGELGFENNALPFFRGMLKLRRFGRGLGPSHMGKILYGTRLRKSDFVEEAAAADIEIDEDTLMLDG
ncbi:hypothetical protein M408DRAFT_25862 [Serendipita vermifera MAFF 305830]|uniref:Uncharacterized protein n=1 Tax=Serendipita vermifera MAFF 305830 TaxID=933852 RepID=A0A0C3B0K1_SERVB|nr:hypothetical protein M408DRAFT_25862 [Serendipita vermifera MAFF 305830]